MMLGCCSDFTWYRHKSRQIRLRTETLAKIKEENGAVATEIAAERRGKKKLSQHRVSPSTRATKTGATCSRCFEFFSGEYFGSIVVHFSPHWCVCSKLERFDEVVYNEGHTQWGVLGSCSLILRTGTCFRWFNS